MILYECNKDKNTTNNIASEEKKMTIDEKKHTIEVAKRYLESGAKFDDIEEVEVKCMMKEIAANAVSIGLYNFSKFVVGNISGGDFKTIQKKWKDKKNELIRCLAIIENEGEDLKNILSAVEIEEAVRYTIFEQIQCAENED